MVFRNLTKPAVQAQVCVCVCVFKNKHDFYPICVCIGNKPNPWQDYRRIHMFMVAMGRTHAKEQHKTHTTTYSQHTQTHTNAHAKYAYMLLVACVVVAVVITFTTL